MCEIGGGGGEESVVHSVTWMECSPEFRSHICQMPGDGRSEAACHPEMLGAPNKGGWVEEGEGGGGGRDKASQGTRSRGEGILVPAPRACSTWP